MLSGRNPWDDNGFLDSTPSARSASRPSQGSSPKERAASPPQDEEEQRRRKSWPLATAGHPPMQTTSSRPLKVSASPPAIDPQTHESALFGNPPPLSNEASTQAKERRSQRVQASESAVTGSNDVPACTCRSGSRGGGATGGSPIVVGVGSSTTSSRRPQPALRTPPNSHAHVSQHGEALDRSAEDKKGVSTEEDWEKEARTNQGSTTSSSERSLSPPLLTASAHRPSARLSGSIGGGGGGGGLSVASQPTPASQRMMTPACGSVASPPLHRNLFQRVEDERHTVSQKSSASGMLCPAESGGERIGTVTSPPEEGVGKSASQHRLVNAQCSSATAPSSSPLSRTVERGLSTSAATVTASTASAPASDRSSSSSVSRSAPASSQRSNKEANAESVERAATDTEPISEKDGDELLRSLEWHPCTESHGDARYRNTSAYYCTYCTYTVCIPCFELIPKRLLGLAYAHSNQDGQMNDSGHKNREGENEEQVRRKQRGTHGHSHSPAHGNGVGSLQQTPSVPLAHVTATLDAILSAPATAVVPTPSASPAAKIGARVSSHHHHHHHQSKSKNNVAGNNNEGVGNDLVGGRTRSRRQGLPCCHLCKEGFLMLEAALLHAWRCEGPAPPQRVGKGSRVVFEKENLQRYYYIKEQRQLREDSVAPLVASFEGVLIPHYLSTISARSSRPSPESRSSPSPQLSAPQMEKKAAMTGGPWAMGTDVNTVEGFARDGDGEFMAPLPLHHRNRPCCPEGANFVFTVYNPRLEQSCVWCAVNKCPRTASAAFVVSPHAGRDSGSGSTTITPLLSWRCPPSLPKVPPRSFTLEVPYGAYGFHNMHCLALYLASDLFLRATTEVVAGSAMGVGGPHQLAAAIVVPSQHAAPLLTVDVLHHMATSPLVDQQLLFSAMREQKRKPQQHQKQSPMLWPDGLASEELSLCVDLLRQGRSVAVCGVGSKHFFLAHIAQSVELLPFTVVTIDASRGGAEGFTMSRGSGGGNVAARRQSRLVRELRGAARTVREITSTAAERAFASGKKEIHGMGGTRKRNRGFVDEGARSRPVSRDSIHGASTPLGHEDLQHGSPAVVDGDGNSIGLQGSRETRNSQSHRTPLAAPLTSHGWGSPNQSPSCASVEPCVRVPSMHVACSPTAPIAAEAHRTTQMLQPLSAEAAAMGIAEEGEATKLVELLGSDGRAAARVAAVKGRRWREVWQPEMAFPAATVAVVSDPGAAGGDGNEVSAGENSADGGQVLCRVKEPAITFASPAAAAALARKVTETADGPHVISPYGRHRCVCWFAPPSFTANRLLTSSASSSEMSAAMDPQQHQQHLPPSLGHAMNRLPPSTPQAVMILVIHNVDLLDTAAQGVLLQLCRDWGSQRPHLRLLVSYDDPSWPAGGAASFAATLDAAARLVRVQLRSLLLPRVHEMRLVDSVALLTQSEASATGGGVVSGGGSRGTGSALPLHDTVRRVLLSIPFHYYAILEKMLDIQDMHGEGSHVSMHAIKDELERRGMMVTQNTMKSVMRELTSGRLAHYDPAEHALLLRQHHKLRKVLAEVLAQRQGRSGAETGPRGFAELASS